MLKNSSFFLPFSRNGPRPQDIRKKNKGGRSSHLSTKSHLPELRAKATAANEKQEDNRARREKAQW